LAEVFHQQRAGERRIVDTVCCRSGLHEEAVAAVAVAVAVAVVGTMVTTATSFLWRIIATTHVLQGVVAVRVGGRVGVAVGVVVGILVGFVVGGVVGVGGGQIVGGELVAGGAASVRKYHSCPLSNTSHTLSLPVKDICLPHYLRTSTNLVLSTISISIEFPFRD
jgi:hypothetical protein